MWNIVHADVCRKTPLSILAYTLNTQPHMHTHIPVYTILPETEYGFHAKKGSGKPHTLQANCTTQNQKTKQLKTEECIATRCLMTHTKKKNHSGCRTKLS